jgi:hypothetical protein
MSFWKVFLVLLGLPLGLAILVVPYLLYLATGSRPAFYVVCGLIALVCVVWSTEVAGGLGESHLMHVGYRRADDARSGGAGEHKQANPWLALFVAFSGAPSLVLAASYFLGR